MQLSAFLLRHALNAFLFFQPQFHSQQHEWWGRNSSNSQGAAEHSSRQLFKQMSDSKDQGDLEELGDMAHAADPSGRGENWQTGEWAYAIMSGYPHPLHRNGSELS